jgi:hypothetical protein
LDKPGSEASTLWKYLFEFHRTRRTLGLPSPPVPTVPTVIATDPRHDAHFFELEPAVFPVYAGTPPQHPQGTDVLDSGTTRRRHDRDYASWSLGSPQTKGSQSRADLYRLVPDSDKRCEAVINVWGLLWPASD